jgi:hypothetical protein
MALMAWWKDRILPHLVDRSPQVPGYAYLGTAEPGQNASPRTTHSAPPSTNST